MRRHEIAGQVADLAGPIATRMGLEVVDVELVGTGRNQILRVLVDRDGGASVGDCARLSEALSRELDLYDLLMHSYTLEVASPGLDRPLRNDRSKSQNALSARGLALGWPRTARGRNS